MFLHLLFQYLEPSPVLQCKQSFDEANIIYKKLYIFSAICIFPVKKICIFPVKKKTGGTTLPFTIFTSEYKEFFKYSSTSGDKKINFGRQSDDIIK